MKIHCLEGRLSTGQRYFSCCRTGKANGNNHVGLATVQRMGEGWETINCRRCQIALERRYGLKMVAS